MIKIISVVSAMYTVISSLLAYTYLNTNTAANVLMGGVAVLLNLAALAFSWNRIFYKKTIALPVFVIIFKYVILGMVLWALSMAGWLNIPGFLIGSGSLVFSILVAVLIKPFVSKNY